MHLRSIKLAGFKSFVEPTTIDLHRDVTVIVGPNGCGKSNVLDAVSWVLGESAAQRLRGDVLGDIIFNGSDGRAPSARASVELLFDNSEGRLGGDYAAYAELEVRREVSSEGPSHFFLNGQRCRRRDILDVFLGTGFGTRGYSIIQQDRITQLVNSDPDTMREHLEEAAGVSKYRARRHETLNKINLTETNLVQVRLKQDELAKTVRQLRSQASRARRFEEITKKLNAIQAHLTKGQLRAKEAEVQASRDKLHAVDADISEIERQSERLQSEINDLENKEVAQISEQDRVSDRRVAAQTQVNSITNEIERQEQARAGWLASIETKCAQLSESLQTLEFEAIEINQLSTKQKEGNDALSKVTEALGDVERRVAAARNVATSAKEELDSLESRELELRSELATNAGTKQASEATIANLRQLVANAEDPTREISQLDVTIEESTSRLKESEESERQCQLRLAETEARLVQLNAEIRELRPVQNQSIDYLQRARTELAGLQAQMKVALGTEASSAELDAWLLAEGLDQSARLGELLDVEAGWESAVEEVLASRIQGIVAPKFEERLARLGGLVESNVTLIGGESTASSARSEERLELTPLAKKLSGDKAASLSPLIEGVYACKTLDEAQSSLDQLTNTESIVTADGAWIGRHWVRVFRAENQGSGVIDLRSRSTELSEEVNALQAAIDERSLALEELASKVETTSRQREEAYQAFSQASAKLESQRAVLVQHQDRRNSKEQTLIDHKNDHASRIQQIHQLEQSLKDAGNQQDAFSQAHSDIKASLAGTRLELKKANEALFGSEQTFEKTSQDLRSLQLEQSRIEANISFLERSQDRQNTVVKRLLVDIAELIQTDSTSQDSMPKLLVNREEAEAALADIEAKFEEKNTELTNTRNQLNQVRQSFSELAHSKDQLTTRKTHQTGQQAALETELDQIQNVYDDLGGDAASEDSDIDLTQDLQTLENEKEKLTNRVNSLGLINYRAASDLTDAEAEKIELDRQIDDLDSAVSTLRDVIDRIDKETRSSLRDTFDAVNNNFADFFRQLFGGGTAHLKFNGDDILQSGVLIEAQPPGKRVSKISMLSGGERAMAAIAFLFALFKLNPSPVCIFDEVDASLDERNISKFGDLLASMRLETQFVLITHNAGTMELAGNLLGVTMEEAGVSRLVAVNLEDAYAMAAS